MFLLNANKFNSFLKFLSDPTNLCAPTALLKDFGSWLKNRGDVIYESRIVPILDGISWLWKKSSEVYEDISEKLDTYDYDNDYEIPGNFPVRVFDDPDNDFVMGEIDIGEELYDKLEEEVAEAGIVQPDECNTETQSGGYGTTITTHFLGIDAGTVYINYDMYSIPDRMEVMYNGVVVAATSGNVSYTGILF